MSAPHERRALVGNAADEAQVADAKRRETIARTRELEDLRAILDTPAGRRFAWRLLEHCRAFASVRGATDAHTNYNAGRQDVGHFVLAEITEARPAALLQMMQDASKETTDA